MQQARQAGPSKVRDFWFTVHEWIGLGSFVFLFVVALTGSALTFRATLDGWLNPELYRASRAPVLGAGEVARRVEAARPQLRVALIETAMKPGRAAVVSVAPRDPKAVLGYDQVFADPGTGQVTGTRQNRAGWDRAHLMEGVYELHARLMGGTTGRWFLGIIAGLWAVSNIVGLYLTFPRGKPFWSRWKPVWTFSLKSKLPRLMLDLHRSTGLWALIGVTVLAITGFGLNFYGEVAEPLADTLSPARFSEPDDRPQPVLPKLGYADAFQAASAKAGLALRPAVASYDPGEGAYRMGFTRSGRRDYWWLGPSYYYVDGQSGRLIAHDDPYHDSAGRAFLRGLYPLHSGRMFGWPGRLIVFLLGFIVAEMCLTGAWVWWRKQKARALRKAVA